VLNTDDSYLVYTDGSCWTGDRVGAYAWVAIDSDGNEYHHGEAEEDTTISRMELLAAAKALEFLYESCGPSVCLVYSDSEYVVLGAMNRKRKRRINQDLWLYLDSLVDFHELVVFEHVRGHDGDHYNEIVDDLAGKLRKEAQNA
jgi:ribonuclease HI